MFGQEDTGVQTGLIELNDNKSYGMRVKESLGYPWCVEVVALEETVAWIGLLRCVIAWVGTSFWVGNGI
jgi:hypothetical protein